MGTKQRITVGEKSSTYHAELYIDPTELQKAMKDKKVTNLKKGKALFEILIDKYDAVPLYEATTT